MANQDVKAQDAEARREAAKRDADILAEAEMIKRDTERFSLAQQMATQMALESKDRSSAYESIASGGLNYPKMEEQMAEQSVAPSAGKV